MPTEAIFGVDKQMKKRILIFTSILLMTVGLISVPKDTFAYVYDTVETFTDINGCTVTARRTYSVSIWNEVTLVNFQYDRVCP